MVFIYNFITKFRILDINASIKFIKNTIYNVKEINGFFNKKIFLLEI